MFSEALKYNKDFDLLSNNPLDFKTSDILVVHKVKQHEIGRPDLLSILYYDTPRLYWFILKANNITSTGFVTRNKFKIDYSDSTYEENLSEIYLGRPLVILTKEYLAKYMRS
jgi:hypothetical protein